MLAIAPSTGLPELVPHTGLPELVPPTGLPELVPPTGLPELVEGLFLPRGLGLAPEGRKKGPAFDKLRQGGVGEWVPGWERRP